MLKGKRRFLILVLVTIIVLNCFVVTLNAASGKNTFDYSIKKGDTLYSLALRFNTTLKDITILNPGISANKLIIGSNIKITAGSGIILYYVKKGDTLWKIAQKYNSSVSVIAKKNNIKDPNIIYTGDILAIPQNEVQKEVIRLSNQVITLMKNNDFEGISSFVHPVKGLRFSPYSCVDVKTNLVFSVSQISGFASEDKEYVWGAYDGSGDPISLTPIKYYNRFVYDKDFANSIDINFNKVLGRGNALENQFQVYVGCNIIEYYIPGSNQYSGMDWGSLRLVWEKYNNKWFLVGIIHNQWTI